MYRSLRRVAPVAVVAVISVGLAACDIAVDGHGGLGIELASGRAQDQWTRSYKVGGGGRFGDRDRGPRRDRDDRGPRDSVETSSAGEE